MQLNLLETQSNNTKFSTLSANMDKPLKSGYHTKNSVEFAPIQLKNQGRFKINLKQFKIEKTKRSKTITMGVDMEKKLSNGNYFSTKKLTIIEEYDNMKSRQKLIKQPLTYREMKIKQDNQKLLNILKTYEVNRKDYRKRIQTEVEQYLTLRENIRKFKKGKLSGENFDIKIGKKGEQYKKFLADAIQDTRRKISQKQLWTLKTEGNVKDTEY